MSVDRHIFVILGATGDLARRKLLPALYRLFTQKNLKDTCLILGAGTKKIGVEGFRQKTHESLVSAGFPSQEVKQWCEACIYYQSLAKFPDDYWEMASQIEALERKFKLPGNRVFYLALPPSILPDMIEKIGESGLNKSEGWTRIVIEKPFGKDLSSAKELNHLVREYFDESQIFRIDHYLGKETVQNLLVFRFANTIFESLWNRDRIESMEITVAEDLGIEGRARYYEETGALKDIVQNHLSQLLALTAMEVPSSFEAEAIRNEKVKVLRLIASINPRNIAFGQYTKGNIDGKKVPGYHEEPGVNPNSSTETYAAFRMEVDSWRWQGVPFYLRTGKRLPRRITQIVVNFRHPPICLFKPFSSCQIHSNRLLISLQPDEGFHLFFDVKEPGEPFRLKTERLHFHYKEAFGRLPGAYQTLILDLLKGDQTLFVRSDEAEAAWEIFSPLFKKDFPVYPYAAGSWGPPEADQLLARDMKQWINP
ncbi:glucose-6-phosphate dehydrogenase [Acidobacteriota bacterium]